MDRLVTAEQVTRTYAKRIDERPGALSLFGGDETPTVVGSGAGRSTSVFNINEINGAPLVNTSFLRSGQQFITEAKAETPQTFRRLDKFYNAMLQQVPTTITKPHSHVKRQTVVNTGMLKSGRQFTHVQGSVLYKDHEAKSLRLENFYLNTLQALEDPSIPRPKSHVKKTIVQFGQHFEKVGVPATEKEYPDHETRLKYVRRTSKAVAEAIIANGVKPRSHVYGKVMKPLVKQELDFSAGQQYDNRPVSRPEERNSRLARFYSDTLKATQDGISMGYKAHSHVKKKITKLSEVNVINLRFITSGYQFQKGNSSAPQPIRRPVNRLDRFYNRMLMAMEDSPIKPHPHVRKPANSIVVAPSA